MLEIHPHSFVFKAVFDASAYQSRIFYFTKTNTVSLIHSHTLIDTIYFTLNVTSSQSIQKLERPTIMKKSTDVLLP